MAAATTSTCPRPNPAICASSFKQSSRATGYGIKNIDIKPYQFGSLAQPLLRRDRPGRAARHLPHATSRRAELLDRGRRQGRPSASSDRRGGQVEPGEGWGSIEPFLYLNDQLVTWNDVEPVQELEDGYLPIPSVTWTRAERPAEDHGLRGRRARSLVAVAALPGQQRFARAARRAGCSWRCVRSGSTRPGSRSAPAAARSTCRSWPTTAATVAIDRDKRGDRAEPPGQLRRRALRGRQHHRLSAARRAARARPRCSTSSATPRARSPSTSISPPAQQKDVFLVVPLFKEQPAGCRPSPTDEDAARLWAEAFDATVKDWHRALDRVSIELPGNDQKIVEALKTTLAYILINADGPALQPGPRAYKRTWIRDGALISAALLRMAHPEEVRRFIEWYAPYQFTGRRHSLLRRRARRRPRGRARQPRRMALPDRRILPLLARRRPAHRDVAEHPRRGRLHRQPAPGAPHRGVPAARQADVLWPGAEIDQPRGLHPEPGALLLGRPVRAARAEGCDPDGDRARRERPRRRLRPHARRVPRRSLRLDRAQHAAARHRLHPGRRRARRFRLHLDRDRRRSGRRAAQPAGARVPGRRSRSTIAISRRARTTGPTIRSSSATRPTSSGSSGR